MADIPILAEVIAAEAAAIDYNNANTDAIAAGIAQEAATLSEDEFYQLALDYIKQNAQFDNIVIKINEFLDKLEEYNLPEKFGGGSIAARTA